jgi:hypothetical protein
MAATITDSNSLSVAHPPDVAKMPLWDARGEEIARQGRKNLCWPSSYGSYL